MPPTERERLLAEAPSEWKARALYDWPFWAREGQLPPAGDWRTWLILAGRGFGKTRTGAEWVRASIRDFPLVNLIGATADDARDIMVDGESGILAVCPQWERPVYRKSERVLLWPNGAKSLIFTADEPERLRGKQHMKIWADELAAWRYPGEAWSQAMLGLRLGGNPQAVVTTTPKPVPALRELLKAETTAVTRGTSYENRANLAPAFFAEIITRYEGTRLGRQELNAELLEDNPDALWQRGPMLEALRVMRAPDLRRIVVAIDPSVTTTGNEAGIIVAGLGGDGHGYLLEDRSLQGSPDEWARAAVTAYHRNRADRIVAEVNNGGEMVETTLRTVERSIPYKALHASRGKRTRAEPIAALYEQGRVHHVGTFAALEDEYCSWTPGDDSPNRLDAAVWALTELMLPEQEQSKTPAVNPIAISGGSSYSPGRASQSPVRSPFRR